MNKLDRWDCFTNNTIALPLFSLSIVFDTRRGRNLPPPPPRAPQKIIFQDFILYFVSLLGVLFLGRAPVDGYCILLR